MLSPLTSLVSRGRAALGNQKRVGPLHCPPLKRGQSKEVFENKRLERSYDFDAMPATAGATQPVSAETRRGTRLESTTLSKATGVEFLPIMGSRKGCECSEWRGEATPWKDDCRRKRGAKGPNKANMYHEIIYLAQKTNPKQSH